jgi:hypothetical protein
MVAVLDEGGRPGQVARGALVAVEAQRPRRAARLDEALLGAVGGQAAAVERAGEPGRPR